MVCLGNICRSPLAEGIMQDKINKAGLDWQVDSAGTGNYHIGAAPHHLSQKVAKLNGVDICAQCARQFVKEDMQRFDKIYVMDSDNYNEVKRISGNRFDPAKVDLILNASAPGTNRGVPDPWYGEEDDYHKVYQMLDEACEAIIERYK